MAHPIRPDSRYIEINNFYTMTVYNKGAEVVRMMRTICSGCARIRQRHGRYIFERHDGQAVTCDDFRAAMADANGVDLNQFERWYLQAGTPVLHARGSWDPAAGTYSLTLRQDCPPTPGQEEKLPFQMPVAVGLLGRDGSEVVPTTICELREAQQVFRFEGLAEEPVPSVLRDFSAPVKLRMEQSDAELAFLLAHDTDAFNRWEAGQRLATRVILGAADALAAGADAPETPAVFIDAFRATLNAGDLDPALQAYALSLPDLATLAEECDAPIDPEALHAARRAVRKDLAAALRADLERVHDALAAEAVGRTAAAAARRSLRNLCLGLLAANDDGQATQLAEDRYRAADNMTDAVAALVALSGLDYPARERAFSDFHERWREEDLVLNKWFALQAAADRPDVLAEVDRLLEHPDFERTNPNKVRALVDGFAANLPAFHAADGAGYRWLADRILELDPVNPKVAARTAGAFTVWRRYDSGRQALMQAELERIVAADGLSKDTYEIVHRTLDASAQPAGV